MCLDKLGEFRTRRKGYQVFEVKNGGIVPLYAAKVYASWRRGNVYVPIRVWEDDQRDGVVFAFGAPTYHTGFHIYTRKDAAVALARDTAAGCRIATEVRVVEFDEVVAKGVWNGDRVVVARRRRVGERVCWFNSDGEKGGNEDGGFQTETDGGWGGEYEADPA